MLTHTIVSCAVLIAGICLCAYGAAGDNSLLTKSKEIGTMDGGPTPNYWWLTTDRLMYFEHVPRPISEEERKKLGGLPEDFAPGYFKAFTLYVNTEQRTAFDIFNAAIGETIEAKPMLMSYGGGPPTETVYHMPPCAISPDLEWFVWKSKSSSHAAKFDGTQSMNWPSQGRDGAVCWLPARQWAEIGLDYQAGQWMNTQATIHDLSAKEVRKVAIDQPESGIFLGSTPKGALLSMNYASQMQTASSTIPVNSYDLSGSKAKVSNYEISLPGDCRIWSVTLSPLGERLAWVLNKDGKFHIYVSDLLGKHWSDLGDIDMSLPNKTPGKMSWPQGIQWLPDGNDLSFVFDGKLYRIAVPSG